MHCSGWLSEASGIGARILDELEGPLGGGVPVLKPGCKRRTWFAGHGTVVPKYLAYYSIVVQYVNNYFKWFGLWRIGDGRRTVKGGPCFRGKCRQARMAVPLELELEGELDGAGAADLVEGVEAAVGAAGAQAAG